MMPLRRAMLMLPYAAYSYAAALIIDYARHAASTFFLLRAPRACRR